ncbi:MAG: hypothetical protein RIS47_2203 [Bacteroidota bacterium]|jgi:carboxypeptidase PM20D1
MRRKIFSLLLVLITILVCIVGVNTLLFRSQQMELTQIAPQDLPDSVAERLGGAVRIPTVSYDNDSLVDYQQFAVLYAYLQKSFPRVHRTLTHQIVGKHSVLYKWEGSDPKLLPMVLAGHLDVVPVQEVDLEHWEHPPFSGLVADSAIWGRGTVDDKGAVVGLLEAVDLLLKQGFTPQRTVYLSFGYDEETHSRGARDLVQYLVSQKIRADFVMDEGLVITRGLVPGVTKDVAMIGIAEKGNLSLELRASIEGGHSSMPAEETAIEVLATAILRIRAHSFEPEISLPISQFMNKIGPELPWVTKMAFANRWLFKPIIYSVYKAAPSSSSLVETTVVPTIFNAGLKENAIPTEARAVVNIRLLPGLTLNQARGYISDAISDKRIQVRDLGDPSEATVVSSAESHGYHAIEKSIRELSPNILVAPSLMVAYADARYYTAISDNVYRFYPVTFNADELNMLHGSNEHITLAKYFQSIQYYYGIIKNGSQARLEL